MYYYSFSYLAISAEVVEGDSCGFMSENPVTINDFKSVVKKKRPLIASLSEINILAIKKVTKEQYNYFYCLYDNF